MSRICYATREDVKRAPDFKESARNNAQIDRALESSADKIDGFCHRRFYPVLATRYFDWPNFQRAYPWRLWLNQNDLISVTSLTSGGFAIPANQYFLEPVNSGPPFTHVELNRATAAAFTAGATPQRAIAITGMWGYSATTAPAGVLAAAVTDTTGTTVTVTDSSAMGVGDSVLIDAERMIVADRAMADTTVAFTGLSASAADNMVTVPDGTKFAAGEILAADGERMLVTDVTGNALSVRRGWDGTVLAEHTSGTLFAARSLTVIRGALGTTAATHGNAAPVLRHKPPSLVRDLSIAESVNQVLQETSGYALVTGEGATVRPAAGAGLAELWDEVMATFARSVRQRVI